METAWFFCLSWQAAGVPEASAHIVGTGNYRGETYSMCFELCSGRVGVARAPGKSPGAIANVQV